MYPEARTADRSTYAVVATNEFRGNGKEHAEYQVKVKV
jgi:hypothetical protein